MAEPNYSKVDEYGFERPQDFDYKTFDSFMSTYIKILTRRSQRWDSLGNLERYKKTNQLKRFVRKGIPLSHRLQAWMSISGALDIRNRTPVTYSELKQKIKNPRVIETIQIDLPRTYPDNIFFSSDEELQGKLFNVLGAFAHHNLDVGYCQGLNYVAGLLLLSVRDEECSFWLLKTLVEQILPNYYVPSMAGLLVDLEVLDELVKKREPLVHRHIHAVEMPWAMAVTKWFICLYSEVLPTETVMRIWDCLFYEGSKILFRVALTLIKLHRREILQAGELGDLINCFKNMRKHTHVINCHLFMKDVFSLPGSLSNDTIEKLRNKHRK